MLREANRLRGAWNLEAGGWEVLMSRGWGGSGKTSQGYAEIGFGNTFWVTRGSKIDPVGSKMQPGSSKIEPGGAKSDPGDPAWGHLGVTVGVFRAPWVASVSFGIHFGFIWVSFEVMWVSFWGHFGRYFDTRAQFSVIFIDGSS